MIPHEIKKILDICYENIEYLKSIIKHIEIFYPKSYKEYQKRYNEIIGGKNNDNINSK